VLIQQGALVLKPLSSFVATFTLNLVTGAELIPVGNLGNHIIVGLIGAAAGAFGSYIVDLGIERMAVRKNSMAYQCLLDAGKYVVAVRGANDLLCRASVILIQLEPEKLLESTQQVNVLRN
jgi:hypothetical protein